MLKNKIMASIVAVAMLFTIGATCMTASAATDLSIVSATYVAGNQSLDITLSASVAATFDWSKVDLYINSDNNNRSESFALFETADNYGPLTNVTGWGNGTEDAVPASIDGSSATFNIRPTRYNPSFARLIENLENGNVAHPGESKEGFYFVFNEGWITADGYEYTSPQAVGVIANTWSNYSAGIYAVPQPTPTETPTPTPTEAPSATPTPSSGPVVEEGNVYITYIPSGKVFDVDIIWGNLTFVYQQGVWNGSQFGTGEWTYDASTVTVENNSNFAVDYSALFSNDATTSVTESGVYATMTNTSGTLASADISGTTQGVINVTANGVPDEARLGTGEFNVDVITVTIEEA